MEPTGDPSKILCKICGVVLKKHDPDDETCWLYSGLTVLG